MNELLSKFDSGQLMGLVSLVGGLAFTLLICVGKSWQQVRQTEITANLKKHMLDRGMSAEEIKTVLDAGPK